MRWRTGSVWRRRQAPPEPAVGDEDDARGNRGIERGQRNKSVGSDRSF
jgi:hypothetical protein